MELKNILKNGTSISSSGTTGPAKQIYQSPDKIKRANKVARDVQKITNTSKIYTVCKLDPWRFTCPKLYRFEIDALCILNNLIPFWVSNIKYFTPINNGMALVVTKTQVGPI